MTSRILKAWEIIRESLTDAEVARLMKSGVFEELIEQALTEPDLDRAFLAFRQQIRQTVEESYTLSIKDTPKAGKVDGVPAIAFDHLSPRVVEAVRFLESDAINRLKGDVKEITRAYIENGLRDGTSPKAVARQLRSVIGMAPNQARAVDNFEIMLRSGNGEALTRSLRDRRFDNTITKAFADGKRLSESQIETMTGAYKRKMIAYNANVNASTHTRDAYKLGQKLSWEDADQKGVIPEGFQAVKTWIHLDGQDDPRPHHEAMNGETVPVGENYSNGDSYAGEGDPWHCHCLDKFSVARTA